MNKETLKFIFLDLIIVQNLHIAIYGPATTKYGLA